jgi:hypothetical protein
LVDGELYPALKALGYCQKGKSFPTPAYLLCLSVPGIDNGGGSGRLGNAGRTLRWEWLK